MVYRGGPTPRARAPRGNVIDDMVSQFADRYAFVRELVQNSIDAGATHIRVAVEEAEGRTLTSVEDDGSGMTLDIIEGPLVTLFSSSKEGQDGKIGRYGVGFMSVFAVDPVEVEVDTRTAKGRYLVRIFRDQSYEITALPFREGTGTIVTLIGDASTADEHAGRVEEAITRWCRHVRVPVELDALGTKTIVSRPFDLAAPIALRREKDGITVVVGPTQGTDALILDEEPVEGRGDYAGFFAHGLTLHETSDPALVIPGIRFKVQSADLSHTLSRDHVCRDRAYDRAMRLVRATVKEIPAEIASALRSSASMIAHGDLVPQYDALLQAATRLRTSEVTLPLLEPCGAHATMTLAAMLQANPVLHHGESPSDGSRALAARGVPAVWSRGGPPPLTSCFWIALTDIPLADPIDWASLTPAEQRILARIITAVASLRRPNVSVVFARWRGVHAQSMPLMIGDVHGISPPWTRIAGKAPIGTATGSAMLVLNVDHDVILRARGLAERCSASHRGARFTLETIAAIVARIAHLDTVGAVDRDANEALLSFVAEARHGV